MASYINTNIASLNAQRNLTASQGALTTSLQRLSSGLRINSAKDDAAGLAISERMSSQIRGLNQAARNANDGISLAQTAEGALGEIGNNLQRIRELAVQSRNATNSASDREALDKEVQALKAEIERVAKQTSFNGINLLDGSFTSQAFQIGANQGQTISIDNIANANTDALGAWTVASTSGSVTATGIAANTMSINGVTIDAADGDAKAIAAAINAKSTATGVSATATNELDLGAFNTLDTTNNTDLITLSIGGVNVLEDVVVTNVDSNAVLTAIKNKEAQFAAVGITMNADASDLTELKLTRTDGTNVDVVFSAVEADGTTVSTISDGGFDNAAGADGKTTMRGSVELTSFNPSSFEIAGASAALGIGDEKVAIATEQGFEDENVLTAANADKMIVAMDAALKAVNSARAELGAVQNRFSSVIANLSTTSENLSASRSRIQDTDFAEETASLTRAQILQQAGTAMLAQANSLPNNVLTLLRG